MITLLKTFTSLVLVMFLLLLCPPWVAYAQDRYEPDNTVGTTVLNADTNDTQIWISMLTTNAGIYYVRADSQGALGTGSYDLAVSDYGTGDAYEMDNSPSTASNFVVGVSQPHSLHWTGDTDYSKFTNTANHLYLIEFTNYYAAIFSITATTLHAFSL